MKHRNQTTKTEKQNEIQNMACTTKATVTTHTLSKRNRKICDKQMRDKNILASCSKLVSPNPG